MAVLVQYANGVPGVKFSLDKQIVSIGRSIENDICINDSFVSKYHAVIEIIPKNDSRHGDFDFVLYDLKSTNATYVNSKKIDARSLTHEDVVRIGENEFRFVQSDENPINFIETDVLSNSTLNFTSAALAPTINNEVTVGMDDYALTDNASVMLDTKDNKSASQFSRRLNIF